MAYELITVQPVLQNLLLNEQIDYVQFEQMGLQMQLFTIKLVELLSDKINAKEFLSKVNNTQDKFKEIQLSNLQLHILHTIGMQFQKVSVYECSAIPDLVKKFNIAFLQGTKNQMENILDDKKNTEEVKDSENNNSSNQINENLSVKQQFKQQFNYHETDYLTNTNNIQEQKNIILKKAKLIDSENEDELKHLIHIFNDTTMLFDVISSKNIDWCMQNDIYSFTQLLENINKISKKDDQSKTQIYYRIIDQLKSTYFNQEITQQVVKIIFDQQISGNLLFTLDSHYNHIKALQTIYPQGKWDAQLRSAVLKLMSKDIFDIEQKFICRFADIFTTDEGLQELKKAKMKLSNQESQQYMLCKFLRGELQEHEIFNYQMCYQIKNNGHILLLSPHLVKHCDMYHGYCDSYNLELLQQYQMNERAQMQERCIQYQGNDQKRQTRQKAENGEFQGVKIHNSEEQPANKIYFYEIEIKQKNSPFVAAINFLSQGVTKIFYIIYNPEDYYIFNLSDTRQNELEKKCAFLTLRGNGNVNLATNLNTLIHPTYGTLQKDQNGIYMVAANQLKELVSISSNEFTDNQMEFIQLDKPEYRLQVTASMWLSSDAQNIHFDYNCGTIEIVMNNVKYEQIISKEELTVKKIEILVTLSNGTERNKVINNTVEQIIEISSVLEPFDDPMKIINVIGKYTFETNLNGQKLTFSNEKYIYLTSWIQNPHHVRIGGNNEETVHFKISPFRYANSVVLVFLLKEKPLQDQVFQYLVIESPDIRKSVKDTQYYVGKTNQFGQCMIHLDNKNENRFILIKTRIAGSTQPVKMNVEIPMPQYEVNRLTNEIYSIDTSIQRIVFYSQEKLKEVQVNGIPRGLTKLEQYVYAFQVEANMFSNSISEIKHLDPLNANQNLQQPLVVGVTSSNIKFELFKLQLIPQGLLYREQTSNLESDFIIPKAFQVQDISNSENVQIVVPKGFETKLYATRSWNELKYKDEEVHLSNKASYRCLLNRQPTSCEERDLADDHVYLNHISAQFNELNEFQCIPRPSIALKERKNQQHVRPLAGHRHGNMMHRKMKALGNSADVMMDCAMDQMVQQECCFDEGESCEMDGATFAAPMMMCAAPQNGFALGGAIKRNMMYGNAAPQMMHCTALCAAAPMPMASFRSANLRGAKMLMNEATIEGDNFQDQRIINSGTPLPYRFREAEIRLEHVQGNEFYDIFAIKMGNVDNSGFSHIHITIHGNFYLKNIIIPLHIQNLDSLVPVQVENTKVVQKISQKQVTLEFRNTGNNNNKSPQIKQINGDNLRYVLESLKISDDHAKMVEEELNNNEVGIKCDSGEYTKENLLEILLYLKLVNSKQFNRYANFILTKGNEHDKRIALLLTQTENNQQIQNILKQVLQLDVYSQLLLYRLYPTTILKNLLKLSNNQVIIDIVNQKLTNPPNNLLQLLLMVLFTLGVKEESQQEIVEEIKGKFTFLSDNKEISEPQGGKINLVQFIPEKSLPQGVQYSYEVKSGGELIHEFNNFCSIQVKQSGALEISLTIRSGQNQIFKFNDKVNIWQQVKKSQDDLLREELKQAQKDNKLSTIDVKQILKYELGQFEFAKVIFEYYSIKNPTHQEKLVQIIDYQIKKIFKANLYLMCPVIMHLYDQYNYDIEQNFNKYKKQEEKQIAFFLRAHHLSQLIQTENIKDEELKIKNQDVIKLDNSQFEKIDIYQYIRQYVMNQYNKMYFSVPQLCYIYPQIQQRSFVQQLYQLTKDQQLTNLDKPSQHTEQIKHIYQLQFIHSIIYQDYENLFAAALYSNQCKVAEKCLGLGQQKLNSQRFQALVKYFKKNYMCYDQNNQSFNTHVAESLSRYGRILQPSKDRFSQSNKKKNIFTNTNKLYLFNQETKTLLINLNYKNYSSNSNISIYGYKDFIQGNQLQLQSEQKDDMLIYQIKTLPKIILRINTDFHEIELPVKSEYKLFIKSRYPQKCCYIIDKDNKILKCAKIQLKDENREIVKCLITDILGYFYIPSDRVKYAYLENGEYVEVS